MARKKKVDLSAFEGVLSNLGYENVMRQEETTDVTNLLDNDGIENLDQNNTTSNLNTNAEDGEKQDPHEDNSPVPDNILNDNNNTSDPDNVNPDDQNDDDDDTTNVDDQPNETETQNIGLFFDAFAEELGWDVSDDEKPKSYTELVDYIGEIIHQNSTPQYANEQVAQLDAYIKNGGKFEDFYQRQQESISYENMDLEDESNQKAAVREYLRYQGYDDDQISRKIERYEDGDMLEEEAEDALARLKSIRAQELQEQERAQAEARQAQEEQARQFMNSLTESVNKLDNIRGIAIPKQDRKELFDYITKVDADGLTRYQKDFNANMVNNLIESAYFTMKGDALLGEATRSGRTSAANKLRTILRHQSTNHSRYNVNDNQQRSVVDLASQFFG